ncbi:hypothetical protein PoB_001968500 [Plakobranchus ocellatus]|uniref:Ig-like domain-containing protein n=1 Tax=Plakobranchus ocellatus TaxID=259542 RepID=A0AAV3ZDH6_9GAST|nr:hypothetical protein PoB_001968500 [Plakobranchus ocellatus]
MTMGIVYRAGVDGWFAKYTFKGSVKKSQSDPKHLIKDLGANYTIDQNYGHVIEATLEITVTPNMEGSRIICYPDVASSDILLNLAEKNDTHGVWSKPFKIKFFPGTPTLKVQYKSSSKVIVGGETIIAKCDALVESGGTVVWELNATSKKYKWKGGKSQGPQKPADWVTLTEREEEFDYHTYEGPRVHSELQLIANDRMAKATLHCYSYEGQNSFTNPVTGATVNTAVSEPPFDFTRSSVASESALRSAGTLLLRVRTPSLAPWPDVGP